MTSNKLPGFVRILSRYPAGLLVSFMMAGSTTAGTVAWFYALDTDKVVFEAIAGKPMRTVISGNCSISEYRIGPHRVLAAKMGSGCVNTTATVSTVLALNPVDRVISTGPAGGLTAEAGPGSWLRVQEVVAWQSGRAGENGQVSPGKSAFAKLTYVSEDWPEGDWQRFQSGKLVSGEAFIASSEIRSRLAAEHSASAVEMNAFGILGGIAGRNLKLLILRIVSDRADEAASEDFALFLKNYDGKGGRIVAEIVQKLPVEPNEPAAHNALRELLND